MTNHNYRGYVFSIDRHLDGEGFAVDFPDIPGIITSGSTLNEAFAHACEALDLYLDTLAEFGQSPPEPRYRLSVEAVPVSR